MIYKTYIPRYPLSEFVDWFWFYEGYCPAHTKERLLPEGVMELVIDLQSKPKRLYDPDDHLRAREYRGSWISGAHSRFIIIEATANSSMMGIHFKPGGAYPFFGFPVTELKDDVVELDQIWGRPAVELREQLLDLADSTAKFRALEEFLMRFARKPLQPDQTVAFALQYFMRTPETQTINDVAGRVGISHKHFIAEFSKWVGLTPKLFCRVRRFQQALRTVERQHAVKWADVACACGYYDQAHFIHDFQAFSGGSPSNFLDERGGRVNYIPMGE